jgi:hypothetical protein
MAIHFVVSVQLISKHPKGEVVEHYGPIHPIPFGGLC